MAEDPDPDGPQNDHIQTVNSKLKRILKIAVGLLSMILVLVLAVYSTYAINGHSFCFKDCESESKSESLVERPMMFCPSEEHYAIDTPGCQLPNFCTNSEDIADFTNATQLEDPMCGSRDYEFDSERPPLFETYASGLHLQPQLLERYGIIPTEAVNCCYSSIVPKFEPYEKDYTTGDSYPIKCRGETCKNPPNVTGRCFPLNPNMPWWFIPRQVHMLYMLCYREIKKTPRIVYQDYFSFIRRDDPELEARCEAAGSCDQKNRMFNVIIIGVDSGSQLNRKRNLVQTHEVLTNLLDAVELHGYNSVDNSSLSSFTSVAAGMTTAVLQESCRSGESDSAGCPKFLWEAFAERGFATALVEDPPTVNPSVGLRSMRKSAVDNFGSPLIEEAVLARGHTNIMGVKVCAGHRHTASMVLNYGVQFMAAHTDQPYFGLMWLHSATNVNMNALRLLDQPLAAALRDMHTKKLLERTVVVVVAGRGSGNANPGFKATAQGEAETKNPFAYIYLPKTFRDTYPSVFEAVKINANRLVTPFDLHNTLLSLADPDQYLSHYSVAANLVDGGKPKVQSDASNNGRKLEFSAPNTDETKPNVVNLFDQITLTRTCLEAGIQPSFCMCVRRPGLPTTDHHVIDMAQRMVKILNDYLFYHDECYGLKLKEVLYAEKLPKAPTPKTYFLKFSTLPKPMVFEGIFEFFFRKTNQPQQYSVNITNVITTPMVRKTNCVQLLLEKKNFQQILFGERHWKPQD